MSIPGIENLKVTAGRAATIIEMRMEELRAERPGGTDKNITVMTVHLIPLGAIAVLTALAAILVAF